MSIAHQIQKVDVPADSPALIRYDRACRAIAEAKSVDDVQEIRSKAEAMRAYAKQAKNTQLELDAAEIRMRAERRLGELIVAQKVAVGLNEGGRPKTSTKLEGVSLKPTLAQAGIDHKLSARAQKMAAVPTEEFESMVGDWRDRVETENARVTTNLLKAGEKRLARDEKEAALAEAIRAASESLGQGRFGVIYADPPWRFEPYSRDTGMDRAADNHYPTMLLDDIAALDVPAADDCVLFLWATAPMLPEALATITAWGFTYKSQIVWLKDRIGTGYWARNKHEILLISTKGNIPAPEPGTQPESVIIAPVGEHSAKPDEFAELIERLFPNLPKIEMFSRRQRPGWAGWGAEAESVRAVGTCQPDDGPMAALGSDKSAALNPESDGGAFAAVTSKAQLADAIGVEPSLSDIDPQPTSPEVDAPVEPTSSQAKQEMPEPVANGSGANFKEGCLKPKACKVHFTSALCSVCANERAKARAAA